MSCKPALALLTTLLFAIALICPAAHGQDSDLAAQLEALRNTVTRQQADLDKQQEQIASQLVLIDKLEAELRARGAQTHDGEDGKANQAMVGLNTGEDRPDAMQPDDTETVGPDASEGQKEAIAELERREIKGEASPPVDSQQTLYDPSNSVFDPNFPGAWHLPGTTAAMKVGGYVNFALVNNVDPLVAKDRFIVGTIPTSGQDSPDASRGTSVTANQSRFNIEVREHTEYGQLRAFIEADFLGEIDDADAFRLRHAYGQYRWLLAGQTWTALANRDALPEQVDFEGINGAILRRQPQLRFFPSLGNQFSLVISAEDPETAVESGIGDTGFADIVVSVDKLPLTRSRAWNYKVGAIFRDLRAKVDASDASPVQRTTGWGLTTSGRLASPVWGESDDIAWQISYGRGIGGYLNDLNEVGGGDAVFDPSGKLHPLPVFAGFVSYQHEWDNKWLNSLPGLWRSNFNFSWIDISNFDFQDGSAYNQTLYTSANLIYFPTQNARIGLEFLWGQRTNKDRTRGDAAQIQLSTRFTF
jgi:hypothetical protein